MRRLIKAFIGGKRVAIPMNEFHKGQRVHLIPTHSIERLEFPYSSYRKVDAFTPRYNSIQNTSELRKAVRKGVKLPPIYVREMDPRQRLTRKPWGLEERKPYHHFRVENGHHRLSAHQAEGKRFIRAIILPAGRHTGPEMSSIKSSVLSKTRTSSGF